VRPAATASYLGGVLLGAAYGPARTIIRARPSRFFANIWPKSATAGTERTYL
jgi:hypothetical protein